MHNQQVFLAVLAYSFVNMSGFFSKSGGFHSFLKLTSSQRRTGWNMPTITHKWRGTDTLKFTRLIVVLWMGLSSIEMVFLPHEERIQVAVGVSVWNNRFGIICSLCHLFSHYCINLQGETLDVFFFPEETPNLVSMWIHPFWEDSIQYDPPQFYTSWQRSAALEHSLRGQRLVKAPGT